MMTILEIRPIKPDNNTIIVRWNADCGAWRQLTWKQWLAFRFRKAPIPGLTGDHYFACCVVDWEGKVCNIVTHRYRLDHAGLITRQPFDDMSDEEREVFWELEKRYYASDPADPLKSGGESFTDAERKAFEDFHDRIRRSSLPPHDAALALLRDLPNGLSRDPAAAVHELFRELGIETGTEFIKPPPELVEAILARCRTVDRAFEEAIEIAVALERRGLVIVPRARVPDLN